MRTVKYFLLVLLCFNFLKTTSLQSQWTSAGAIYGGDITSILISGSKIYAGTEDGGGLFISSNGGVNWTASNSGFKGLSITALGRGTDSTRIFAGTDSGMYVSTNSGVTWNSSDIGLPDTINSIERKDAVIYAGTPRGLYRSTNNGSSWVNVNVGYSNPSISSIVFSGTSMFVGTYQFGVLRSTNNGLNWKKISYGLHPFVKSLSISDSSFSIFAGTTTGVYKTSLNDTSWVRVFNTLNISCVLVIQSYVYASLDSKLYKSDVYNSKVWTNINNGLTSAFINTLSGNSSRILVGTVDAGIFVSTNSGANWSSSNTGLNSLATYSLLNSCNNLFAGTPIGTYLSRNSGSNWSSVNSGFSNFTLINLTIIGNMIFGIRYGDNGYLYRTTNNGTNWSEIAGSGATALFVKGTRLFAGTEDDGVGVSTDNGISWQPANSGLPIKDSLHDNGIFSFTSIGSKIFCGTYGRGVYSSTNFGGIWKRVNSGLTDSTIYTLTSINSIILAGTENGIFLSTNNGANWSSSNSGLTNKFVIKLSSFNGKLFCGTFGSGVFESTNNGTSWTQINSGFTNNFIVIDFESDGTNIYAATSGGVWKRLLSELEPGNNIVSEIDNYNLLQNYPNPFNPRTIIRYELPATALVKLKVYNILGQQVLTLVNKYQYKGIHEVELDATNLAGGIYFYELKTDNFTETKRMLLIK